MFGHHSKLTMQINNAIECYSKKLYQDSYDCFIDFGVTWQNFLKNSAGLKGGVWTPITRTNETISLLHTTGNWKMHDSATFNQLLSIQSHLQKIHHFLEMLSKETA